MTASSTNQKLKDWVDEWAEHLPARRRPLV